jgi:ATP adenylyltransferase
MKLIWAPWRIEYIVRHDEGECIFCTFPKEDRDRENLILYRGERCFIILNRYPYNNGHIMVVPYRHVPSPLDLDEDEILESQKLVNLSIRVLDGVMKPHGYNIGINIGKAAGAGIDGHYHIHVVPRWLGDTNFMPIIGDTKVVVEAIANTYEKLLAELRKIQGKDDR